MARVRAGDDRAFEALYDRHHRPLLAFCRHLLGSADEAEDALQHTFIAAHRALRTDERPVMLRPWLFTIARNRCLSLLRSRRNVVALTEVGADPARHGRSGRPGRAARRPPGCSSTICTR